MDKKNKETIMYDMQSSMLYVDSIPCEDYVENINIILDYFNPEDMGKRHGYSEFDMCETK